VVADIAKLSVGREAYYTRELATDHEAYLSGHGESPGRWYGAGASSLGLQGEASPAGFQAMFEGRDPTTGELLGRPHGRKQVAFLITGQFREYTDASHPEVEHPQAG
jgi:TrwC relaxase